MTTTLTATAETHGIPGTVAALVYHTNPAWLVGYWRLDTVDGVEVDAETLLKLRQLAFARFEPNGYFEMQVKGESRKGVWFVNLDVNLLCLNDQTFEKPVATGSKVFPLNLETERFSIIEKDIRLVFVRQ